jgi:DNA-binding Lrp family transcriptional regulator
MLTDLEKQIVIELQNGLPLVPKPYQEIAERLGLAENELIIKIKEMIERGIIRRFGAAVRHQDLGFTANAMVVWDVPEEQAPAAGRLLAGFAEVTHCYQRTRRPGWPYNIFTVIHGQTREECERIASRMAQKTGFNNYRLLFSTRELKKSTMKYFLD